MLEITKVNPAGNITLFVNGKVEKDKRVKTAKTLLNIPNLNGEQVAFFVKPKFGGEFRIEMMGQEFCGNALRGAAFLQNKRGKILGEISGFDGVLETEVMRDKAYAHIPCPIEMNKKKFNEKELDSVLFDGILHFISLEKIDSTLNDFRNASREYNVSSVGLISYFDGKMIPRVYVRDTDTLFDENSCASGSAALACYLSVIEEKGYDGKFSQPGGIIEAKVSLKDKKISDIVIGGPIKIEDQFQISITSK